MISIDTWDWRFRVAFDRALQSSVKKSVDAMDRGPAQLLMQQQLDTYSGLFSVGQLVSHCCDEEKPIEPALDAADTLQALFLPKCLVEAYGKRIDSSTRLSTEQKKVLRRIVGRAAEAKFCNVHQEIFEPIFGSRLSKLLKHAEERNVGRFHDRFMKGNDLAGLTSEILDDLRAEPPLKLRSLLEAYPKFNIKVVRGAGFAEYWPVSLSHAELNELVVYDNPDQLGYENFRATVAHEVLGHATFYALAERSEPSFFDHGALALIEGWATWVEWTASSEQLAAHLRATNCRALRRFRLQDAQAIEQDIFAAASRLGYSVEAARAGIEYFFQYPGLTFSYTLGALWFEERFAECDPAEFWKGLHRKPWGDFFASW